MKIQKLRNQERGVSVILGAILLMGILILTFPIIYHQHVKSKMIDNEEAQMENVKEQFLELQSKISFMEGPNDNGQIKIPMSAGSVPLFPGQSPAGIISTSKGSGKPTSSASGDTEILTMKPGTIKFKGKNLYYPQQNYILEAGHVILEQDGKSIMISPNEDLITYSNSLTGNKLEIKYPYLNKTMSISSTSTETITLTWGGRKRYPENKELIKTNQILKFTFETDHIEAWKTYLQAKNDNITNINFEVGNTSDIVYMKTPADANFTYYVSSTELEGEVKEPIVSTIGNGTVGYESADLIMSYDFKDFSEGEVRFKWKEKENGSWASSGWETQYGANSTYSNRITGLKPEKTYEYKAQIKYNSKTKEGNVKTLNTTYKPEYGTGNESNDGSGVINPSGPKALYLQDEEYVSGTTVKLTFKNQGGGTKYVNKSRVAFLSYARPGNENQGQGNSWSPADQWKSDITGSDWHDIRGKFINSTINFSIPMGGTNSFEITFDETVSGNNIDSWFMYQIILNNDAHYTYFVPVPS